MAAGILGVVGAVGVLVACWLPFQSYDAAAYGIKQGPVQGISVFKLSPGAPLSHYTIWFAAVPVGAAILALVSALAVFAVRSGLLQAITAGILIALGFQVFLLFGAYGFAYGWFLGGFDTSMGPGAPVGMIAGVLLAAAGLLGALSRRTQVPVPNPMAGVTVPSAPPFPAAPAAFPVGPAAPPLWAGPAVPPAPAVPPLPSGPGAPPAPPGSAGPPLPAP